MSAVPKRLVAYVEFDPQLDGKPWRWFIEIAEGRSGAARFVDSTREVYALDCIRLAEERALVHGFDLRWHGFVAHGVQLQEERVDD